MLNTLRAMLLVLVASTSLSLSNAYAAGPFEALAGNWGGAGLIQFTDGSSEKIRCQASYDVKGGNTLNLHLRCASSGGYNINASSSTHLKNGSVTGSWQETTRNESGGVSGTAKGNTINVILNGGTRMRLVMTTNATEQNVQIVPQENPSIKRVHIAMRRK